MKKLSITFSLLALLLSHVMCAVVAYNYASMLVCGKQGSCSAPASTAFLLAIPFGVGIIVCVALAIIFKHKANENTQHNSSIRLK